jgi:hypothetical protein
MCQAARGALVHPIPIKQRAQHVVSRSASRQVDRAWHARAQREHGRKYEDYAPAYRCGWDACVKYGSVGRTFDERLDALLGVGILTAPPATENGENGGGEEEAA